MTEKRCPVCGADGATCGPRTTVRPVDQLLEGRRTMGKLTRYPNPERPGSFIMLDEAAALAAGLDPEAPEVPATARTGPPGPVTSATAGGPTTGQARPPGALSPGGPTQAARRRRAATASPPMPEPEAEPKGDDDDEADPAHKARPAPRPRRPRKSR